VAASHEGRVGHRPNPCYNFGCCTPAVFQDALLDSSRNFTAAGQTAAVQEPAFFDHSNPEL